MQRLCATRYSHARSVTGRSSWRSAEYARRKTSCSTSSASPLDRDSIWRV